MKVYKKRVEFTDEEVFFAEKILEDIRTYVLYTALDKLGYCKDLKAFNSNMIFITTESNHVVTAFCSNYRTIRKKDSFEIIFNEYNEQHTKCTIIHTKKLLHYAASSTLFQNSASKLLSMVYRLVAEFGLRIMIYSTIYSTMSSSDDLRRIRDFIRHDQYIVEMISAIVYKRITHIDLGVLSLFYGDKMANEIEWRINLVCDKNADSFKKEFRKSIFDVIKYEFINDICGYTMSKFVRVYRYGIICASALSFDNIFKRYSVNYDEFIEMHDFKSAHKECDTQKENIFNPMYFCENNVINDNGNANIEELKTFAHSLPFAKLSSIIINSNDIHRQIGDIDVDYDIAETEYDIISIISDILHETMHFVQMFDQNNFPDIDTIESKIQLLNDILSDNSIFSINNSGDIPDQFAAIYNFIADEIDMLGKYDAYYPADLLFDEKDAEVTAAILIINGYLKLGIVDTVVYKDIISAEEIRALAAKWHEVFKLYDDMINNMPDEGIIQVINRITNNSK